MKPVVDRLEKKYEGAIEFRRYNVETDPKGIDIANAYGVTGVPTFIFVNSDGVSAGQIVGSTTEAQMVQAIEGLK
ncbi:MAG: thioredoxin family protein [Actinobacteria bacterium]|nr:MAG: thioredoxin family protein [Actinomycetota bacterium]